MKKYTFGILVKFGPGDHGTGYIDWEVTDEQNAIIHEAMEEELDFRFVEELSGLYNEVKEAAFKQEFENYNEDLEEEDQVTREQFQNMFGWVHFINPDELPW